MREIKFRAWIKKEKRMTNVEIIDFTAEKIKYIDKNFLGDPTLKTEFFENVALSEYTGLKDIAGDEIHEGDIVRDVSDGIVGYIEYSDGSYVIVYDDITEKLNADESAYLEVIGNIYENPELLGEGGAK